MNQPLAERLRPTTLDDYIGQTHITGPEGIVRRMISTGQIASFILWGPPGVGKTTLARIIANTLEAPFYTLSAVSAGVKDVRDVIDRCKADAESIFTKGRPILFIDEIHRFNKSQQDSLLGAVENGTVTHRSHNRESVVRSHPSAAVKGSGLYPQTARQRRAAPAARPCADKRQNPQQPKGRDCIDRSIVPLRRRRRTQASQHHRPARQFDACRQADSHRRRHRHRAASDQPRRLRQKRRSPLRHNLGLHKKYPRKRPRCRHLLARPHD